jgi:hypothetical protein
MREIARQVKREWFLFRDSDSGARLYGVTHFRHTFAAYWLAAHFLEGFTHAGAALGEEAFQMFVADCIADTNKHASYYNANNSHYQDDYFTSVF